MIARTCIHNPGCMCEDARCSIKCGWNPRGAAARQKEIRTNGLTARNDGRRRLVLKKGAGNEK